MNKITSEVLSEVGRQKKLWGTQNHAPAVYLAILTEEVGEVARAVIEKKHFHAREELVQVAAVAMSMADSIDRDAYCECELCRPKEL